jgi:hypothetical protein
MAASKVFEIWNFIIYLFIYYGRNGKGITIFPFIYLN